MTTRESESTKVLVVDPCSSMRAGNTALPSTSRETTRTAADVVSGAQASGSGPSGGPSPPAHATVVPYPDRVALCTIPELALKNQPRVRPEEVWEALAKVFSPLEAKFAQIQYIRADRFRVWCQSPEILEDLIGAGIEIRGHPVRIIPFQDRSWVTITHLPYGLIEKDIECALSPYGKVAEVTFVKFRNVRTGTVKVRMDIHQTIPTRIRVCGHAGLVYHQGQVRTCYNCGAPGHESRRCPNKATAAKSTPSAPPGEAAPAPPQQRRKRKRSKGKKKAPSTGASVAPPVVVPPESSGTDSLPAKKATFDALALDGAYEEVDIAETGGGETDPVGEAPPSVPMSDVGPEPSMVTEFILDSVEAAERAPPHPVLDIAHPRQPRAPCFRGFEGSYLYSEEGELDLSIPPELRLGLGRRGDEIRGIMKGYDETDPYYNIFDDLLVVRLSEEEQVEVPIVHSRAALAKFFTG